MNTPNGREVQGSSLRCHCSKDIFHDRIGSKWLNLNLDFLSLLCRLTLCSWFRSLKLMHQNWYTNVKIGLAPASGEICTCDTWVKSFWVNMHPDKLICLLVLNLKMPVTKVTGVSFGTPKDYMLQNLKMITLSIWYWKPQLSYKW